MLLQGVGHISRTWICKAWNQIVKRRRKLRTEKRKAWSIALLQVFNHFLTANLDIFVNWPKSPWNVLPKINPPADQITCAITPLNFRVLSWGDNNQVGFGKPPVFNVQRDQTKHNSLKSVSIYSIYSSSGWLAFMWDEEGGGIVACPWVWHRTIHCTTELVFLTVSS